MKKKEKLKSVDKILNELVNADDIVPEPINLGKMSGSLTPIGDNPSGPLAYLACKGCFCTHCYTYWNEVEKRWFRVCMSWNQCNHKVDPKLGYRLD